MVTMIEAQLTREDVTKPEALLEPSDRLALALDTFHLVLRHEGADELAPRDRARLVRACKDLETDLCSALDDIGDVLFRLGAATSATA